MRNVRQFSKDRRMGSAYAELGCGLLLLITLGIAQLFNGDLGTVAIAFAVIISLLGALAAVDAERG